MKSRQKLMKLMIFYAQVANRQIKLLLVALLQILIKLVLS